MASAKKPAGGEAAGAPAAKRSRCEADGDLPDSREGAVTPAMDDPVTILDERTLTIQEAVWTSEERGGFGFLMNMDVRPPVLICMSFSNFFKPLNEYEIGEHPVSQSD